MSTAELVKSGDPLALVESGVSGAGGCVIFFCFIFCNYLLWIVVYKCTGRYIISLQSHETLSTNYPTYYQSGGYSLSTRSAVYKGILLVDSAYKCFHIWHYQGLRQCYFAHFCSLFPDAASAWDSQHLEIRKRSKIILFLTAVCRVKTCHLQVSGEANLCRQLDCT